MQIAHISSRWSFLGGSITLGLALMFVLVTLFTTVPAVHAQIIAVDTTEDELNDDGDCSLREAIEAANTDTMVDECPAGNGADTITLPAGIYTLTIAGTDEDANATGDLDIINDLIIQGAGESDTIINAAQLDRALHTVYMTSTLTVQQLQIVNGSVADHGGGIYSSGDLHLQNMGVYSGTVTGVTEGGGVYVAGSSYFTETTFAYSSARLGGGASLGVATLTDVTFANNTGTAQAGGLYMRTFDVQITGGLFEGNQAGVAGGGGAYTRGGIISGTTFIENNTTAFNNNWGGGGLFNGPGALSLILNNTTFLRNTSSRLGGGAYLISSNNTINNMTAVSNTAPFGGGLVIHNASGLVSGGYFEQNSATGNGGGILSGWGGGGGGTISGTVFVSNTANTGGGAYVNRTTTLSNLRLVGNEASSSDFGGGGLSLWQGVFQVENSLFVGNSAPVGNALSIMRQQGNNTTLYLEHNTIVSPTAGNGSAVYLRSDGNSMFNYITNNIITNHTIGIENQTDVNTVAEEDYNLYDSVTQRVSGVVVTGTNSITGTPGFVNAGAGDYHITEDSIAVDAGTDAGVTVDVDGDTRPSRNGYDIGFDEVPIVYTLTVATTGTGNGVVTPDVGIHSYNEDSVVNPTAVANAGSTFTGWSGACTGTGACSITMDSAKSVTATFTLNQYDLTTTTDGTGSGTVILDPAGGTYDHGTMVTVTYSADAGSTFTSWSGACTGTGACVVTMDSAKSVTATFDLMGEPDYFIYLPFVARPNG